jgi:hypothetical protein
MNSMTKQIIARESIVSKSEGLLATKLDDEVVLMGVDQGFYYGMQKVGDRIWELISTPCPVSEIIQTLLTEYDVEEEKCWNEVRAFLNDLMNEGLVKVENPKL